MKKPQPIDCERALARIFEFIDRELKAHEHEAMQQHLQTCKSCYSRVEFERRLMGRLKELRDAEASVTVRRRIDKLLKSF
jgi:anti-sigma factor (TIGR02949 family)